MNHRISLTIALLTALVMTCFTGCSKANEAAPVTTETTTIETTEETLPSESTETETAEWETTAEETTEAWTEPETEPPVIIPEDEVISWNPDWQYAEFSKIHDDDVTLYYSHSEDRCGYVVAINAGHGTPGGDSAKTPCHPDGSPKVTGGSTGKGATSATAVAGGTTMKDGTPENQVTLSLALLLKEELLDAGFDVLMIREDGDCQLDNIARTVFANNNADCHIAIHYDSSESDKGFFYISVPNVDSYRNMEPVASHWQDHHAFGDALLDGIRNQEVKIFGDGTMAIDLTQTSYSTVPSVDVEVGDRHSDYSEATQSRIAHGLAEGVCAYFAE